MEVNFYLRNPKAKETAIVAHFYFKGKFLKYYPGISVHTDQWDAGRQRVTRYHENVVHINNVLAKIRELIVTKHLEALAKGETITPKELKRRVNEARGLSAPEVITVVSFVEQFISERKQDKRYRRGSIVVYQTVLKHLSEFDSSLTFDEIDVPWFFQFVEYLYEKDFAQNYVQKVISTVKTFLNAATDRGINKNLKYKSRAFSVPKQRVYHIHLTNDELDKLYKVKLSGPVENARDCFLIQCHTGLRYSDLDKLTEGNFQDVDGRPVLRVVQWKTRDVVFVPRKPIIDEIWKKHSGKLPIVSNQKMNVYVKDAAKAAGINTTVTITKNIGGERKDEMRYKYELVTTHTGRRTMICSMFKEGYPTETIMKISGHRSHASFMAYLQLSAEEHLAGMKDAFFNS